MTVMLERTSRSDAWKLEGKCREYDPELFFSPENTQDSSAANQRRIQYAKSICAKCPVSGNCLDEALAHSEAGVWGGTSSDDRRSIKRRGSRVTCVRCGSRDRASVDNGQVCLRCGLSWLV